MQGQSRFHELDSLRALAAIGVVAWHYTNHFGASPAAGLMAPFYRHGLLLVDFFFVLSGFVLARVYWTKQRSGSVVSNIQSRIGRMYPLHFAMLILVAFMQFVLTSKLDSPPFVYSVNDKYDFVLNVFLLNRSGMERALSFNGTSWSISTEFIVNIIFLAAIALPYKATRCVFAAVFAVSAYIVFSNGLISNEKVLGWISNDIFRTAFGFLIGVATYKIFTAIHGMNKASPLTADLVTVLAVYVFVIYCARWGLSGYRDIAATVLLFPVIILATVNGKFVKYALTLRPLVYLGEISFSIYLVHFPLQLAIHMVGVKFGASIPYDEPYFLVLFMLGTILSASITYELIEKPGKKIMAKGLLRLSTYRAASQGH